MHTHGQSSHSLGHCTQWKLHCTFLDYAVQLPSQVLDKCWDYTVQLPRQGLAECQLSFWPVPRPNSRHLALGRRPGSNTGGYASYDWFKHRRQSSRTYTSEWPRGGRILRSHEGAESQGVGRCEVVGALGLHCSEYGCSHIPVN